MTTPNGFPAVEAVTDCHEAERVSPPRAGLHLPKPEPGTSFRTIRVKVFNTDRVLQLGTMAAAHTPGTLPFLTDTKQAAEFPSFAIATIVSNELTRRLNASGGATWVLDVVEVVHESTESWSALHRFDRTALEVAYFLAESLPKWVR